jgi:TonB family protein
MEMRSVQQQLTRVPETLSAERRLRVRRKPLTLTCVKLAESDVGIVANISETGMGLTSATPLRENCRSHLCFHLPQLYGAIATRAEIVWMTESKKEAGVRFVDLPNEVREQIRMWVSLAAGNRKSQEREERPCNVEDHLSTASTVAAMPPRPATGESVPQSSPLTEVRRAEFERMFPSENGANNSREISASKSASLSEPVAEAAPGAVSATAVILPELAVTHAVEEESAPKAEAGRSIDDRFVHAAPSPRAPIQTLGASLPAAQPIVDRSPRAIFRTEPGDFARETRPKRPWPIAALATLLVVICFALGFVAGPDFSLKWPKAQEARRMILEKLNRFKIPTKNADLSNQNASKAAAPSLNVPASSQGAAPGPPARTVDENTPGNAAPDESEQGDSATLQFADRLNKGASGVKTPDGRTTSMPEPFVTRDELKPRSPKKSTSSANLSGNADETFDAAAAPPEPARITPAPTEKTHGSKPKTSEPREMTSGPPAEEPPSSPTVNAAMNAPASAKTPTTTETPDTSLTAKNSATTATDSSAHQPVPSDVPATEAPARPAPATPPVRPAEPAPRPANPPPSFFPVVAPGAGNVPRLLELPSEPVIDTVAALVSSRQFVFVPAEPGPESGHKPERVQMGERISKIAPVYPGEAAQKGMGGTVLLRATIGKDGTVESVRPISGPALLIPSAIEALRQWRYGPTLLDQQPIEMQEDITIEFRPRAPF